MIYTDTHRFIADYRGYMSTNKDDRELLYEDLTYTIRGCTFNVYNELGFGHKENVYQKALAIEFEKAGVPFKREESLDVVYQDEKVGTYVPDFVVGGKIIIEIKAVPKVPKSAETQLTYYLKGTQYSLGLLINFGGKKLDIRRRIWTPHK